MGDVGEPQDEEGIEETLESADLRVGGAESLFPSSLLSFLPCLSVLPSVSPTHCGLRSEPEQPIP